MSSHTVARDIKRFKTEQAEKGVDLLGYKEGSYNPITGQGYPSIFRLHFLRYALRAIDMALNMSKSEYKYSWEALEAAAEMIVAEIPRTPVVISSPSLRAECEKPMKPQSQMNMEKMAALQDKVLKAMVAEGWSDEEIEEAFDVLNQARARYLEQVRGAASENGDYLHENMEEVVSKTEFQPGGHGEQDADHVQSENLGICESGNLEIQLSSEVHGEQDADHVPDEQGSENGSNGNSPLVLKDCDAQDLAYGQPGFVWGRQKGGRN